MHAGSVFLPNNFLFYQTILLTKLSNDSFYYSKMNSFHSLLVFPYQEIILSLEYKEDIQGTR